MAAALVAVPVALAVGDQPIRTNLDADAQEELVMPQPVGSNGGRKRIVVVDTCNFRNAVYPVSPFHEKIDRLTALDTDGKAAQKEILFSLSSSGGARGYIKLFKMAPPKRPRGACPRPVTLFAWASGKPTYRPPGLVFATAALDVKELSRKYRGRELRLMEAWGRSRANPSHWRYTFYRLLADGSAYVSYGTSDIKR